MSKRTGVVLALLIAAVVAAITGAFWLAHQDRVVRSRVGGVVEALKRLRSPVSEYRAEKGTWPTTWRQLEPWQVRDPNEEVGGVLREIVSNIRLEGDGVIAADVTAAGKAGRIRMVPQDAGAEWTCRADAEIQSVAPPDCRR